MTTLEAEEPVPDAAEDELDVAAGWEVEAGGA